MQVITPKQPTVFACRGHKSLTLSGDHQHVELNIACKEDWTNVSVALSVIEISDVADFIVSRFIDGNRHPDSVTFSEGSSTFNIYHDNFGDPFEEGAVFELNTVTTDGESKNTDVARCFLSSEKMKEFVVTAKRLATRISLYNARTD